MQSYNFFIFFLYMPFIHVSKCYAELNMPKFKSYVSNLYDYAITIFINFLDARHE